jgi:hypothetical protein
MYNVSSETLVNIAFTKVIKLSKNKNIFCAIPCKGVQERKNGLHLFAGDCMRGEKYREKNVY